MERQPRLADKTVIVTGASSGLGRAIALKIAAEGARLVMCADLKPGARVELPSGVLSEAEEPTHEIICRTCGSEKAVFQKTDISNASEMEDCIQAAVSASGRLDVIVNNAGLLAPLARIHETEVENWDRVFNINVRGLFFSSKFACAQFLKQDRDSVGCRGKIVNIASICGLVGFPVNTDYSTSKAAVVQITRCTAIDYAPDGIQCNAVCPGLMPTAMTKDLFDSDWIKGRMESLTPLWNAPPGSCKDGVANTVAFLASSEASYLTGAAIPVDGAYTAL